MSAPSIPLDKLANILQSLSPEDIAALLAHQTPQNQTTAQAPASSATAQGSQLPAASQVPPASVQHPGADGNAAGFPGPIPNTAPQPTQTHTDAASFGDFAYTPAVSSTPPPGFTASDSAASAAAFGAGVQGYAVAFPAQHTWESPSGDNAFGAVAGSSAYFPSAAQALASRGGSVPHPTPQGFSFSSSSGSTSQPHLSLSVPGSSRSSWGNNRAGPSNVPSSVSTRVFSGGAGNTFASRIPSPLSAQLQLPVTTTSKPKPSRSFGKKRTPKPKRVKISSWIVVPCPSITHLHEVVKHASAASGLFKIFELYSNMTAAEVHVAIVEAFEVIDIAVLGYEFCLMRKAFGNQLIAAPVPVGGRPSGLDLTAMYGDKEKRGIIRLRQRADIPLFWAEVENMGGLPGGDADEDEDEEEEEEERFVACPKCESSFLLVDLETHMMGCKLPTAPAKKTRKRHRSLSGASSSTSTSASSTFKKSKTVTSKRKGKMPAHLASDSDSEYNADMDKDGDPLQAAPFPGLSPPFTPNGGSGSEDPEDENEGGDDVLAGGRYALRNTPAQSGVEPVVLCPYCDDPFPPQPTEALLQLLEAANNISKPAPTLDNPNHRHLPIVRATAVCMRHRAESRLLLEPGAQDWPRDIDFGSINARLARRTEELIAFTRNPAAGAFPDFDVLSSQAEMGQLIPHLGADEDDVGDGLGCGYYGQAGWETISQFLVQAVVPSIDPLAILPFTHLDFRLHVLIPFAASLLISEDLPQLSQDGVWDVLKRSKSYGLMFFPAEE